MRTYRKIKTNYETENYVKFNCTKYQRSLIAQLRMGILPLAVEIAIYECLSQCFWCKDSIEDEFHFICNCTLYSDLRSSLFNSIQVEIGNIALFTRRKMCKNHEF